MRTFGGAANEGRTSSLNVMICSHIRIMKLTKPMYYHRCIRWTSGRLTSTQAHTTVTRLIGVCASQSIRTIEKKKSWAYISPTSVTMSGGWTLSASIWENLNIAVTVELIYAEIATRRKMQTVSFERQTVGMGRGCRSEVMQEGIYEKFPWESEMNGRDAPSNHQLSYTGYLLQQTHAVGSQNDLQLRGMVSAIRSDIHWTPPTAILQSGHHVWGNILDALLPSEFPGVRAARYLVLGSRVYYRMTGDLFFSRYGQHSDRRGSKVYRGYSLTPAHYALLKLWRKTQMCIKN